MGTCWESIRGGHHFRAWRQNGTEANSGAWFLGYVQFKAPTFFYGHPGADTPGLFVMHSLTLLFHCPRASEEMDSSKNHMIVDDGYNRGRNYIVARATTGSHWKGTWWKAEVEWKDGLLESGNRGPYRPHFILSTIVLMWNDDAAIGVNHGIEQDGLVAILTVYRL